MATFRSPGRRPVTGLPPIDTAPPRAGSSPATTRSRVVLPVPDGPSTVR
jgi:hypothetical protein